VPQSPPIRTNEKGVIKIPSLLQTSLIAVLATFLAPVELVSYLVAFDFGIQAPSQVYPLILEFVGG
jgi:hypothetical protein